MRNRHKKRTFWPMTSQRGPSAGWYRKMKPGPCSRYSGTSPTCRMQHDMLNRETTSLGLQSDVQHCKVHACSERKLAWKGVPEAVP